MNPIQAIEQNYQYGAFGALTGGSKVGRRPAVNIEGIDPSRRTGGENPYQANLNFNYEVTPTLEAKGSTYTNGVGHSNYGMGFKPYFA